VIKRIFSCFLFPLLLLTHFASAADWKALHEQADAMNLKEALARVSSSPDSQDALYLLGLVCLNEYKETEAQSAFTKILALNPRSIPAFWGVAEVARRRHALDEAEEALTKIIAEEASFSPAYNSLAYIRYLKFDFQGSVKLAQKVLAQGEDRVDLSNYALAYLLVAAGKGMLAHYGGPVVKIVHGTAIFPTLRKAHELKPESAAVYFGLGSFYLLAPRMIGGDIAKAQLYLEKAAEIDPHLAGVYVRLGQIYKLKGDSQKYQQYLGKALEIDPGNEIALDIQNGSCKFICIDRQQ